MKISIWHTFKKPPWGGGNQFLLALRKALRKRNIDVIENEIDADVHLVNSIHFDFRKFEGAGIEKIVHRIDGPISFSRGEAGREADELCFSLNKRFAIISIMQSAWSLTNMIKLGYPPTNPIIIYNAVDDSIFNKIGRIEYNKKKVKLISTSWSDNPRKGIETYKWLDKYLNWNKFQYTFVGRIKTSFKNICLLPPMNSEQLSKILKEHDIFISASRVESCSNSVLEALACGLPVLYYNNGGHPEIIEFGGLPFISNEELLQQLNIMVDYYHIFQNLIPKHDIHKVADQYIKVFNMVMET